MGKMGVSDADKVKAVTLLAEKGMAESVRVAPLRKLPDETRVRVVLALSVFAFPDYSRSASSEVACDCCSGTGFIEAEVFTNKVHTPFPAKELVKASIRFGVEGFRPSEYEVRRELREVVRVKCKACNGKGKVSTACRDCSGRGTAVDKKESAKQGFRSEEPASDAQAVAMSAYQRHTLTQPCRWSPIRFPRRPIRP